MRILGSDSVVADAKELGLEVTSGFIDWRAIGYPKKSASPKVTDIVAAAKKMGLKHMVFGYVGKGVRETVEQIKALSNCANELGKLCQDAGIQLCYHNHSFEFKKLDGDTTGFDVFIQEFDEQLCKFELDVFWAKIGGLDPFETLKKLDGRVSQVHLKDLKDGVQTIYDEGAVPKDAFQECGDGSIDMGKVMSVAAQIGVQQCHVEQDHSPNPIASVQQSLKHLKTLS